ncbi:glycosyltransferase family 2 protein [Phycicoccus flavus]|uniref:glycosyltransferase family 2 protein n=1 Tax=Phycicoccus flavus TaxID=2502783 RepID=UPI000FEB98F0|nr:glycosyltransferase [Phycicoccus flavus]NHA67507.1 glycosyltransferase [Phycicoccus flavus]
MARPALAASVVVPSYRGAHRLPALLAALAAQDTTEPWEVVLVVDGDTDGSERVAKAHRGPLDLRVVVLPENLGRVTALNTGFDAARGRVLVRCDDDLEPAPGYVAAHVAAHAGREVGAVGLYRNVFPETPFARVYGRRADTALREAAYASAESTRWRYWAGNASVTREAWEEVGPYDTAYRAYGWEDVDWGYRLAATGRPVVLDPALETVHRLVATTTGLRARRAFYSGSAREIFSAKHGRVLAEPEPTGAWGRLVRGTARSLSESRLGLAADAVDRLLPVLPDAAGRKAVALLVESGHRAGGRIARVSDPTAV